MLSLIKRRRSIRKFAQRGVDDELINQIIEAGIAAPSGKNNQPWKFVIVKKTGFKEMIAKHTHYSQIIRDAPVLIAVFLDSSLSYDRTKDVQAIGACIQNILLAICALGLGGVWLGEILRNKEAVHAILETPNHLELMAVVALGHPAEDGEKKEKLALDQVVISRR